MSEKSSFDTNITSGEDTFFPLPHAPLAMPEQRLEHSFRLGRKLRIFAYRMAQWRPGL